MTDGRTLVLECGCEVDHPVEKAIFARPCPAHTTDEAVRLYRASVAVVEDAGPETLIASDQGAPKRDYPKPMTVVSPQEHVTQDEMAARVIKTRDEHGPLLQQYHEAWYNAPHTWHYNHFLGVGIMKCPNDLWMYQVLMAENRFQVVIETGTYQGASALWFAYLMDMLQIAGGHVYTVDIEDRRACSHPRISFLDADSTDPLLVDAIKDDMAGDHTHHRHAGPLLVVLDADHSAAHVRKELDLYAPLVKVGDWLVVEDTNIAWGEVHEIELVGSDSGATKEVPTVNWRCSCGLTWQSEGRDYVRKCPNDGKTGDRGARGGLEDYLRAHPGEFRQDVLAERWLLTMNPGGWLQRVAPCPGHG